MYGVRVKSVRYAEAAEFWGEPRIPHWNALEIWWALEVNEALG